MKLPRPSDIRWPILGVIFLGWGMLNLLFAILGDISPEDRIFGFAFYFVWSTAGGAILMRRKAGLILSRVLVAFVIVGGAMGLVQSVRFFANSNIAAPLIWDMGYLAVNLAICAFLWLPSPGEYFAARNLTRRSSRRTNVRGLT